MKRAWRIWRGICVTLVSAALFCLLAIGAWIVTTQALTAPVSVSLSPDKQFEIRVFSAGQSSIPPDYRADVSFVLRRRSDWFWPRDKLVARATLADGWAIRWTAVRALGIEAGPLSSFSFVAGRAGDVTISVHVSSRSPQEARCIDQALANAINGVLCFDALLAATHGREAAKP